MSPYPICRLCEQLHADEADPCDVAAVAEVALERLSAIVEIVERYPEFDDGRPLDEAVERILGAERELAVTLGAERDAERSSAARWQGLYRSAMAEAERLRPLVNDRVPTPS